MFQVAALGVVLTMLLALVRAFLGPSVYDRILALNMFSTKTMLLIAIGGFLGGRPEWMDLALLYAMLSFLALLAVLRFSKYGDLGRDQEPAP